MNESNIIFHPPGILIKNYQLMTSDEMMVRNYILRQSFDHLYTKTSVPFPVKRILLLTSHFSLPYNSLSFL
jgi:hypothetical protein